MDDPWSTSAASSSKASPSERQKSVPSKSLLEWASNFASSENGSISKQGLMKLIRATGLSVDQADQIYNMVVNDENSITRDDLLLTLQLAALAQQNYAISMDSLALATGEGLNLSPKIGVYENAADVITEGVSAFSLRSRNDSDVTGATSDPWKVSAVTTKQSASSSPSPQKVSLPPNAPLYVRNSAAGNNNERDSSVSEAQWFTGKNTIKVILLAEKGGLLFKHLNYGIETPALAASVIRRYSDFTWLYDIITKKYPFRLIPPLPPKKIAVGTDEVFIEQRRKGLYRFINFLGNHPVLKNDETIIDFLKVQTEIQAYKKTNQPSMDEEFTMYRDTWGSLTSSLPNNVDDILRIVKDSLPSILTKYQKFIQIHRESAFLYQDLAKNYLFLSNIAGNMGNEDGFVYCWKNNCPACETIKSGFQSASNHLGNTCDQFKKYATVDAEDASDNFSTFADLVQGFVDLFERAEKCVTTNFDVFNKRIVANQQKLASMGGISPMSKDFERLSSLIENDQKEINFHMERNQFAKYCLLTESQYFHRHRMIVSLIMQQYARGKRDFFAQLFDDFSVFTRSVEQMATEGF